MTFEILYNLIMGLLQGLTEWLPVSSSGHLVLAQEFFEVRERTLLDAILHLGTLLAVSIYFRSDFRVLMNFKNPTTHKIILASLPIIIIGFIIRDYIEATFSLIVIVCLFLIINGCILMLNAFLKEPKRGNKKTKAKNKANDGENNKNESIQINMKNALLIGLFQVFALFPGISRSGTTITTGRALGVDWATAAKFSFFISFIPIAGAAWFKIATSYQEFEPLYILGFIVAFIVGYATIDIMMRILRQGRFHYFGVYTIILGIVMLVLFI